MDSESMSNYNYSNTEVYTQEEMDEKVKGLVGAMEEVVQLNYQHAHDQYGDRGKAENWACVRILKKAIQEAT